MHIDYINCIYFADAVGLVFFFVGPALKGSFMTRLRSVCPAVKWTKAPAQFVTKGSQREHEVLWRTSVGFSARARWTTFVRPASRAKRLKSLILEVVSGNEYRFEHQRSRMTDFLNVTGTVATQLWSSSPLSPRNHGDIFLLNVLNLHIFISSDTYLVSEQRKCVQISSLSTSWLFFSCPIISHIPNVWSYFHRILKDERNI